MPTMHQKMQEFIGAGSYAFSVPAGVYGVFVTMIGGGGSGGTSYSFGNGIGAPGGGAGELVIRFPVRVTPGDSITVVVGAGAPQNTALWPIDFRGGSGFPTSFGSVQALGARGGQNSSFGGGIGGGGDPGPGTLVGVFPTLETPVHIGGAGPADGGPRQGAAFAATGATGQGSGGLLWGGLGGALYQTFSGGGGGAGTIWGPGGAGGRGKGIGGSSHGAGGNTGGNPAATNGLPAPSTSYGAGGGGAGGCEAAYSSKCIWGGAGADGYCLVEWYEEDP